VGTKKGKIEKLVFLMDGLPGRRFIARRISSQFPRCSSINFVFLAFLLLVFFVFPS
jgi:hypothetical protein